MKSKNVSRAYAQAVYELGLKNKLDVVSELTSLTEAINHTNALENVLFLSIFTVEEKTDVIKKISTKFKLSQLVENFLLFLIQENRIGLLPLIYKDLVVIDDDKRGFLKGTIEGHEDKVNVAFKEKILKYLEDKLSSKVELTYKINKEIIAGHKVSVSDLQLDASLDNQLEKFKETLITL